MNTKRNRVVRLLMHGANTAGINVHYLASFRRLPRYYRELAAYRQQAAGTRFDPARGTRAPILSDYDVEAGIARGHYIVDAMAPLSLTAFHAVDDADAVQMDAEMEQFNTAAFSCGMFEFAGDYKRSGDQENNRHSS